MVIFNFLFLQLLFKLLDFLILLTLNHLNLNLLLFDRILRLLLCDLIIFLQLSQLTILLFQFLVHLFYCFGQFFYILMLVLFADKIRVV